VMNESFRTNTGQLSLRGCGRKTLTRNCNSIGQTTGVSGVLLRSYLMILTNPTDRIKHILVLVAAYPSVMRLSAILTTPTTVAGGFPVLRTSGNISRNGRMKESDFV
jgi:hypothetical protein